MPCVFRAACLECVVISTCFILPALHMAEYEASERLLHIKSFGMESMRMISIASRNSRTTQAISEGGEEYMFCTEGKTLE